jgi:hypothetical protein
MRLEIEDVSRKEFFISFRQPENGAIRSNIL